MLTRNGEKGKGGGVEHGGRGAGGGGEGGGRKKEEYIHIATLSPPE